MRSMHLLDWLCPWPRLGDLWRRVQKLEFDLKVAERERDKLREKLATIKAAVEK